MTRQRNDAHSTEFGLWLRQQKSIDSLYGFVATNIDYVWENYKTGDWMLIEEKRYGRDISYPQRIAFNRIHGLCKGDTKYHGMHLLVFECTSPDDGKIWLDRREIDSHELIAFLMFEHLAKG